MIETSLATDNIAVFRNSQGNEASGTLVRLTRHLIVMEVYNPYSIVQLSEVLHDLRIRRGERTIYAGRAVVSNLVSTGFLVIVSATLVDPWSDLIDLLPGPELREEVTHFIDDWETGHQKLIPSYELSVSKLHHFLEELGRWLERGEALAGLESYGSSSELVQDFAADVDHTVGPKLDELFDRFDHEARAIPPELSVIHKSYAQRELHPLMLCSPFLHRSYTKPLGYAGDYEMVNMILSNHWEGTNTYARIVNSYFLRNDTATAHRNRIAKLVSTLTQEAQRTAQEGRCFRVLNVGCGPAKEVDIFIQDTQRTNRCEFTLLDFNEETLAWAMDRINAHVNRTANDMQVTAVHRSIHSLLKEASQRRNDTQPAYDMVYCAGLFDYLSDRICRRLVRLFYDWTTPGGLVLVTNVHRHNPVQGVMTHLADWHLILRDESDLSSLAPELGSQKVYCEKTGVNVFLEIRADSQSADRI